MHYVFALAPALHQLQNILLLSFFFSFFILNRTMEIHRKRTHTKTQRRGKTQKHIKNMETYACTETLHVVLSSHITTCMTQTQHYCIIKKVQIISKTNSRIVLNRVKTW